MISLLMCMYKKKDEKEIVNNARELLVVLGNEDLEVMYYDKKKDIEENLECLSQMQAVIVDVTQKAGLKIAKQIRERYPQIEIMIVADTTISPICYLNPSIRASALLLKPLETEMVKETLKAFIRQFLVQKEANDAESVFVLKKRGEEISIPCNNILYVESREKKIYIRCNAKEYMIYETLESIKETLPECFMRCHRGFLVNRMRIESIKYSEGLIVLDTGEVIPLSRGYKASFKGVMIGE